MDACLAVKCLFLNADAGFDGKSLRTVCEQLDIFPNIDFNERRKKFKCLFGGGALEANLPACGTAGGNS